MEFDQADALNQAIRSIGIRHRALAGALLAPLGLHPGQEVFLLELDVRGARTQAQLALAAGCEPPTITNTAHKLEAAGLVARRPSPTDGRATIVELTQRGRDLMPALKAAWLRLAEQTMAGLTTTPVDQLTAVLADLAGSLSAVGPLRAPRAPGRADSRTSGGPCRCAAMRGRGGQ